MQGLGFRAQGLGCSPLVFVTSTFDFRVAEIRFCGWSELVWSSCGLGLLFLRVRSVFLWFRSRGLGRGGFECSEGGGCGVERLGFGV